MLKIKEEQDNKSKESPFDLYRNSTGNQDLVNNKSFDNTYH